MMHATKISGLDAWGRAQAAANARFGSVPEHFAAEIYPARYEPKFNLDATHQYFCIGSCFARNIEEHLIYRRVTVLSKRYFGPIDEWNLRPNAPVNKFTTHSILNEIRWISDPLPDDPSYYTQGGGGWRDLQMAPGGKPVALERAFERRSYLARDYFARLREADVVIVTLGLNEAWIDEGTGLRLNAPPMLKAIRRDPQRYSIEQTTVAQNVEALIEIRDRLLALNPSVRLVLTVSPVPLDVSFFGEDVVVANMRSKSVLRAAAAEFVAMHADVDYFPSFEMISMAPRALAFIDDCRHVSDSAVGKVVSSFMAAHGLPIEAPEFNEYQYLLANPDVDGAVRSGELVSGFDHWVETGRSEGRALTPLG